MAMSCELALAIALVGYAFIPVVQAFYCDPNYDSNCVQSPLMTTTHIIITVVILVVAVSLFAALFSCYRQRRIRQANLGYVHNAQTGFVPPNQYQYPQAGSAYSQQQQPPQYNTGYGGGSSAMQYPPPSDGPPNKTNALVQPPPPTYSLG